MKSYTCAILSALVFVALAVTPGTAQEEEPSWSLPKDGDVPLNEVVRSYADHAGIAIIYDPKKIMGDVKLKPEDKGRELKGDEIDLFAADSLAEFLYALLPNLGTWSPISSAEAPTAAPVLSRTELAEASDWHWCCVYVRVENTDTNALVAELRKKSTLMGGTVQVAHPEILILVDRADRLKDMMSMVREAEREALYVRYPARDTATAVKTLREKFKDKPATFAVAPGGKHLVARADKPLQQEIAEAAAALK